jgi:hypothetical protein
MIKVIPVGTLMRVRDDALDTGTPNGRVNAKFVRTHGYLHVVMDHSSWDTLILKSLTSGEEHEFFYDDEIEEAPTDD